MDPSLLDIDWKSDILSGDIIITDPNQGSVSGRLSLVENVNLRTQGSLIKNNGSMVTPQH